MTTFDDWTDRVCGALGLDPLSPTDRALVLDLTKDVAHGVLRPAAPVTAYLLGLAVGRGAEPGAAATTVSALAGAWADEHADGAAQPTDAAGR